MEEEYIEKFWIYGKFFWYNNNFLVLFLGSNLGDLGIYKVTDTLIVISNT
jgi:hypothetical protein